MYSQRIRASSAGVAAREAKGHESGDCAVRHCARRTVAPSWEQNGCCGGDEMCELEGK